VYPVPPLAKLDKMKRKWYKTNVDKAFIAEQVPGAGAGAGGNDNS